MKASESEDDSNNGMVFSCSDYDTDELENFVTKKERNITESLQDYKEIVKGMVFKDIAEAKQFCELYAIAKKVELVVVKSDKRRLRYTCAAEGCPFLLLISGDMTTPDVSVKTLVDHLECGTTYDNSLVDYSIIALYFKDKLQNDPKYKAMKLGFKSGLRPLIGLDGTFLKGKAKGQVLCAVGQDNNNYFYPLAWVVAAWLSFTEEFEDQLQEIKEVDEEVGQDLIDKYPSKAWYKPIIEMLELIRVKIMERLTAKKVVVRKWKDDGFSPKSELLFIEYLKISKVCKVSGNGDNGYEVTEGADKHIVNLREKKCTCRTWDLTGITCPHAIKAMEHKKMIPKKEIDWYYKLVKLVGKPKLMRERERIEDVKRQRVWKQTRKGKVMTCSNCGEQNHNARGCEKANQGKQPTKQGKETGREKKRQPRKGLVDEDEASEEDINCTANCTTPQPTQESQSEYAYSSIYFPVVEDDDEDPWLRPRTISEEAFLTRCSYYKPATKVEAKKGMMIMCWLVP
ncbi:hypothetical protein KY290_001754 [Solanum tuberosum]|uniref:SWIM-type domain-containing protein n=1 Tax=Solanum tuberosum TaxID=4113 RepID=A0ABQ7WN82_SOLTU|nr:hypothetical protein KY290_001754 [Solanum tuberosum]